MKLNKIFLLAGVALMGLFASCGDDYEYTSGKLAGNYDVNFSTAGEKSMVFALQDETFDVTVTRSNATGELTVPIQILSAPSCMKIPASVSFANGASTAVFKVEMDSTMKPFTEYLVSLAIPEEYTNPYKTDAYPRYNVSIQKEDYALWKTVGYQSGWSSEIYDVDVYYSKKLDLYRFVNFQGYEGYNFYLKWDGKTTDCKVFQVVDAAGNVNTNKIPTGIVHATYGAVTATWSKASKSNGFFHDPEEGDYFMIAFDWRVSAGSFGVYPDYFWFNDPE